MLTNTGECSLLDFANAGASIKVYANAMLLLDTCKILNILSTALK